MNVAHREGDPGSTRQVGSGRARVRSRRAPGGDPTHDARPPAAARARARRSPSSLRRRDLAVPWPRACGAASAPPPASAGPIELEGTSWLLIKYLKPDGDGLHGAGGGDPLRDVQGRPDPGTGRAATRRPAPTRSTGRRSASARSPAPRWPARGRYGAVEGAYLAALEAVDTATGNATGSCSARRTGSPRWSSCARTSPYGCRGGDSRVPSDDEGARRRSDAGRAPGGRSAARPRLGGTA